MSVTLSWELLSTFSDQGRLGGTSEGPSGTGVSRSKRTKVILGIVVIAAGVTGVFFSAYSLHFLGLGTTSCWARPANLPSDSAYFVVVMGNQGMNVGFNGSRFQAGSWPIMNVTVGKMVTIHVINNDTLQSHGFAVQRYFSGFALGPGTCANVTFTADQSGQFLVYCYISCTIHIFMQNGRLNVNH